MAKRPQDTDMSTFPARLWDVLDAVKAGKSYSWEFPAENFAVNVRHRFHKFRAALIAQKFPGAEALSDVVCTLARPEGKITLEFVNLGVVLSGARPEVANRSLPGQVEASDQAEELLNQMLGIEPASGSVPNGSCEHEWDVTDTFCLKCRMPKP